MENGNRKNRRRQLRRGTSVYHGFDKQDIAVLKNIRESDFWTEELKKMPEELQNDKVFQKNINFKIINSLAEKEMKDTNTGLKTDTETQTNQANVADEFVEDVLNAEGKEVAEECACKKKKVCFLGIAAGVLVLAVLVYFVLKNRK